MNNTLDSGVVQALQDQLNKERQNSAIYGYVAASLQNQAYDGFASFFKKQSLQELDHAQLFVDFLTSKRINPIFKSLNGMGSAATASVLDFAKLSYTTEQSTTSALNELYRIAYEAEEFQVCSFLVDLLTEQIEEESWASNLVDILASSNEATWRVLDTQYK